MSMIHTAYLHDVDGYYGEIFACQLPVSKQLSSWQDPVTRMRQRLRRISCDSTPDWQNELLEYDLERSREEIASNAPVESMRAVRALNHLTLLSYTPEEVGDFYKAWDMLRKGLDAVVGEKYGYELVLGVYWEGEAWDFSPDLVTYQYGLLLPDRISRYADMLAPIRPDAFADILKTLSWQDIYSVYKETISDEAIEDTLQALERLKHNLDLAREESCGIVNFLN